MGIKPPGESGDQQNDDCVSPGGQDLKECFSNFIVLESHLEDLVKMQILIHWAWDGA